MEELDPPPDMGMGYYFSNNLRQLIQKNHSSKTQFTWVKHKVSGSFSPTNI